MAALLQTKTPIVDAIEKSWQATNTPRHGYRVPASQVGSECERALWYSFRWVTAPKQFDGQMLRLFETGNIEETRMIEDLRRAGCTVVEFDGKKKDGTDKQIGVSFADGHGYGFLDAEVAGLPEAPVNVHVAEFKSHNDKSFAKLKADRVQKSKPEHYGQMQIYMHKRNRTRALYLAVNKNTDELYSERIEYDFSYCVALERKAERIAYSPVPLAKLHEDPDSKAAFRCGWCDHRAICHERAFPETNCRTCIYATPARGGAWLCEKHNKELDRAEQNAGCTEHLFIPDIIPGDQVDANLDEGWIAYALADGRSWTNQGGKK